MKSVLRPIPRLFRFPLAAFLLFASLPAPDARADILRVPDDHTTINDALAAAVFGDEIRVSSANSPYAEAITVVDGITMRGGYSPDFLIQDPSSFETVIQRPPGILASVVTLGSGGAGLEFEGFTITGGDSTFSGGGMFCSSGSSFTITNCKFTGNRATVTGAGMQIANGSSVVVSRCLFENNIAGVRGGGITIAAGGDNALIERCTIRACSTGTTGSPAGGAGIFTAAGIRLERNKFQDNSSGTVGGGLFALNTNIRAWGNQFTNNRAANDGGGVYHEGGSGEHRDTLVEDCTAGSDGSGNGGGVYFLGGSNRWVRGFVRSNVAAGGGSTGLGGGFYFKQTADGRVEGAEIVQNISTIGAGVYIEGFPSGTWSFANVVHCTIQGNSASAASAAGGIHIVGQEIGEIVNNIIAFQADGHGIACVMPASPNLRFNDVFSGSGNPDSEYGADCPDRTGVNGNIKLNPAFCNASLTPPDLALQSSSLCLGSGENGEDMGAHDASTTCGTVSIEETSWGKLKSLYR